MEKKKPQQVPIDSEIHFGASTRRYIIRERPQTMQASAGFEDRLGDEVEGGLLGLPETENELDVSKYTPYIDQIHHQCSDEKIKPASFLNFHNTFVG